jgi:hypothetical protein
MERTEFVAMLAECTAITELYLVEAERTSKMLGNCSEKPLTFDQRFALMSQEIQERDAYLIYMSAKRFLHRAALLGYGGLSTN